VSWCIKPFGESSLHWRRRGIDHTLLTVMPRCAILGPAVGR